ncbi:glycosyl hydrolase 53 family protein [Flammeovirga sp. OC4]|uniref:glycoside hydrolase family 53 protein n=1 Tax=Flammeovirga sp. OC4 TaxID=1382345 RepID=UPI0005C75C9D|nr:glycosyl hydrolase 53 family protein [Flammeovirga sp. OC4]
MNIKKLTLAVATALLTISCLKVEDKIKPQAPDDDQEKPVTPPPTENSFYFGADLSYVNQILDHGGDFKMDGASKNPYKIFSEKGTNLVRVRLWHNPSWHSTLYPDGEVYCDLADVEKTIAEAKANNMEVMLDFHYSDTWADPEKQDVPEAWKEITSLEVLSDSVYNYTYNTLVYLNEKGLMPEMVQIGNEINQGILSTGKSEGFPNVSVFDGKWTEQKQLLSSGIEAVKAVNETSDIKAKTIIHIADPSHIEWWFDEGLSGDDAIDCDIIGISYYPLWHDGISFSSLEGAIASFKNKYKKDILIVETAYPWTTEAGDDYNNLFGGQSALTGYDFTLEGQHKFLHDLTQKMMNAGAIGIVYWEPAWVAVPIKTLWGEGSAWENCAFFDYENHNANSAFDFMTDEYE